MRWNRMTPIALAIGVASSVGSMTLALAAPASPARLGEFSTWRSAQSAAGFKLMKPTVTYGLRRTGKISVSKCDVKGHMGKRVVLADYVTPHKGLTLSQDNYGHPCLRVGRVKRLGRYKVNHVTATLVGICGLKGLPSCRSKNILLMLSWAKGHVYYVATSYGEGRKAIVGFARGLVRVR